MSSGDQDNQGGQRPTVFLSYSRVDQDRARALAQALEQAGLQVWWDRLIEGGAAFAKSIDAALTACDAVIVLWSTHSVASDWVLDEAARGRDLKKLVPLSIDGTEAPLGFRQYQSISMGASPRGFDDACLQAVLRAVLPLAGREPPQRLAPTPAPTPASAAPANPARRGLLVGGGAVAVAAAAGLLGWQRGWFAPAAAVGSSVAVLPFKNLSGDPEQGYFSDGLSEEVRATLARNQSLKVMAQTSSGKFRDSDEGAVNIAAKLGVAFLLSASVRWAGENVRVAADLIDGHTGFSKWTQIFERRIDDVFAVQSEIANTVASALAVEVAGPATPEAERAASGGTTDVAAFDAYLRGRSLYDLSADEASERAALAQFDAAIARDPEYAAAHAARSRSLTTIANQYGAVGQHAAMYDQAVASAERAVQLAPAFANGYSTLAFVLFQGRLDAKAARAPFEKSNALGAGEATVQARWAQYCARTGRADEAFEAIQRALLRDRLNPLIHRAAGSIEYAARRYAESIPYLQQALQMNPRMSRAHAAIGDALVNLGSLAEAKAAYAAEPVADFRITGLAIVEHRLGNTVAARAAMNTLVKELGDRALYQQAQVFAQWGDLDASVDRLLKARKAGDSGLVYARNDPFLDPIRADPRVQGLLAEIGFKP